MIGKGATPSFFAIANDNYTLTIQVPNIFARALLSAAVAGLYQ